MWRLALRDAAWMRFSACSASIGIVAADLRSPPLQSKIITTTLMMNDTAKKRSRNTSTTMSSVVMFVWFSSEAWFSIVGAAVGVAVGAVLVGADEGALVVVEKAAPNATCCASPELVAVSVVAVFDVPWFAASCPTHVNTRAWPAVAALFKIVIVMEVVVVDEATPVRSASAIATPFLVPVHTGGVCPVTQIALCSPPPAVNVIVPLAVISVVGVAFSTIFDGVSATVVSSTSPSIAVIAVTELYVAAVLAVASVLEMPVVEITVTTAGCAANSEGVLHVKMIAA